MPQVQIVNSEAAETPNRAEENFKNFFSKLGKDYTNTQDRSEINKILSEAKKNEADENNLLDTTYALEKSNISPSRRLEVQKSINEASKNVAANKKALSEKVKTEQETAEKQQGLIGAKRRVDEQRKLLKEGNVGPKFSFAGTSRKPGSTLSKQGLKDRAQFEQNGKSLIQYATTIPIRNRLEFEVLSQKLFDTDQTVEELSGVLDSMEGIINDSLSAIGYKEQGKAQEAPKFSEGQTATGPNGQKIIFKGGTWQQA